MTMMSNMTNMTNMTILDRCNVTVYDGAERDIFKGMTLGGVGIIGLIGNIFTIALIFSFKKRHVPDILVLSLAFNDIYSVLFPFNIALAAYFYPLRLPQGHWSCELMTLLSLLSRVMSMFLHTLIAVDRFLAIAKPLQYRRLVKPVMSIIIISCFFFISLLVSVIPWIYDSFLDPDTQCLEYLSYSVGSICLFDYTRWYAIIILILGWGQMILFFVVFVTTITITIRYYYRRTRLLKGNDRILQEALNRSSISRKDSKKEPRIMKHITKLGSKMKERKLTEWLWLEFSFEFQFVRMLFLLSILFYLTWAPSLIIIMYTLIFYSGPMGAGGERPQEFIFWGIRIATLNILFNPLIYAVFSTQYRQAYWYAIKKYLLCCCSKYFSKDKISPFDRDEKRRQKKHQFLSGISDISAEVNEPQPSFTRGAQLPGLATISENSLPRGLGRDPVNVEDDPPIPFSLFKKESKAIRFEDENMSLKTQETSVSVTSTSPEAHLKKVDTGAIPTDQGVSIFTLKRQVFEGFNVAPRKQAAKGRGRLSKILSEVPKDKSSKSVKVKGEQILEEEKQGKAVHKTLPRLYSTPYDEDSDPAFLPDKLERTASHKQKRTSLNLT